MKETKRSPNFDRRAWLVAVIALALLFMSTLQIIYRFTLPTDGWSVYTTEVEQSEWVADINLVGVPSGLEQNDVLLAVDGRSVTGKATSEYQEPPPGWRDGSIVTMTVRRGGEQLAIAVPVVHWTAAALWRNNASQLTQAISTLGAFLFLAVGWFTFLRRPHLSSARALLMLSTAIGAAFISGLLPDGLSVMFNRLAFIATFFFSYAIFGTLVAPALLAFTLAFPRPKQVIGQRPWLALLPYGLGLIVLAALLAGAPGIAGWWATMAMLIAAILSLIHSAFSQRDAVSKAQLRWAIGGFVAGIALFLLNFPIAFHWVSDPLLINLFFTVASLGIPVIGVCLAVAVLRYRLFDIDVIIRKTLIYATLTTILALVYFGSVVLLQSLFEAISGQQSALSIVISTLLIAALFAPLRRRLQDMIDRRFFRQKYDAQQVLAYFTETCRDETSLEALKANLAKAMWETMQPEHVSVWLRVSTADSNGPET